MFSNWIKVVMSLTWNVIIGIDCRIWNNDGHFIVWLRAHCTLHKHWHFVAHLSLCNTEWILYTRCLCAYQFYFTFSMHRINMSVCLHIFRNLKPFQAHLSSSTTFVCVSVYRVRNVIRIVGFFLLESLETCFCFSITFSKL